MTQKGRITVLMGGYSSEREVSLASGRALSDALKRAGFQTTDIDVPHDPEALISALKASEPDVVMNALHGRFGEDGGLPALLDAMAIPYTHSGRLASALAMDKAISKILFERVGIPVAPSIVIDRHTLADQTVIAPPYVVKPVDEGSSVGVIIVNDPKRDLEPLAINWPFGNKVMVEAYIPGRELTVGVMGERALEVTEINTGHVFYDYTAKYARGGSTHIVPAPVDASIAAEAKRLALLAHQTLGCRGVSRSDFRLDGDRLYILELNTHPGMTETSLVPEQARAIGLSMEELVCWMVGEATCDP